MSESINTTIYNDNIQSLTSNNINLYTNKLNGQITLGNTNVPVSMNNVSLNNLSVNNIDNIANINVSSLTVNSIICNQPNETKLYFNSDNTLTRIIPSSTTAFATVSLASFLNNIIDFSVQGSVLKEFKNYIITTNLYCKVSPDVNSQIQYKFDILRNGISILTSNYSDDINDLSLNNIMDPSLCNCTFYAYNLLDNVTDREAYTVRITFTIAPTVIAGKSLFMYYNSLFPSYISFISNYNVGYYNNTIKNNYIFSNPYTSINSVLSTFTTNDTAEFSTTSANIDVSYGLPIYLSVGVWNIEMYTVAYPQIAPYYIYLELSYKNSVTPSIVYDTTKYYNYVSLQNHFITIKINSIIVITSPNTYVRPFLKTLTGCTLPLQFKNFNTYTGQVINNASGYNIIRLA
jgi:hypothetical protein